MSTSYLICRLTGMTGENYELQKFESAFNYLKLQLPHDDEAQHILVNSSYFWKWWTLQWDRRNKIVLDQFGYTDHLMPVSEQVRKRATISYNYTHDVNRLRIIINPVVLKSTFRAHRVLEHIAERKRDG